MTTFNEAFAHHIGFSVFDADVTAARYTQMLGREVQASIYELEDIYGRPAKLKLCYGAIAGLAIEIIEPLEGDTPHATFLREHGEGIQHIGFWVPNVRAATADLVGKGSRVEWVYAREGDDAAKAHAAAQLTPASTVGDALGAVSERGLSYVDIKEGGTAIEFLGPYAPRRHLPQGWAARGLGGVDPGRSPRWTNWRLRRASRASRVPTHSARLLGAWGGPNARPACPHPLHGHGRRRAQRCPGVTRPQLQNAITLGAVLLNIALALLQEQAEAALMGRVMSVYTVTFIAATPSGFAQGGIVATVWGP